LGDQVAYVRTEVYMMKGQDQKPLALSNSLLVKCAYQVELHYQSRNDSG